MRSSPPAQPLQAWDRVNKTVPVRAPVENPSFCLFHEQQFPFFYLHKCKSGNDQALARNTEFCFFFNCAAITCLQGVIYYAVNCLEIASLPVCRNSELACSTLKAIWHIEGRDFTLLQHSARSSCPRCWQKSPSNFLKLPEWCCYSLKLWDGFCHKAIIINYYVIIITTQALSVLIWCLCLAVVVVPAAFTVVPFLNSCLSPVWWFSDFTLHVHHCNMIKQISGRALFCLEAFMHCLLFYGVSGGSPSTHVCCPPPLPSFP